MGRSRSPAQRAVGSTTGGLDAAVSHYGSGNNDLVGLIDHAPCPLMFHYGSNDPFIPEQKFAEIERAGQGRPNVEIQWCDAGHAFSNWDAPSNYESEAAELAWTRTLKLFAMHLD